MTGKLLLVPSNLHLRPPLIWDYLCKIPSSVFQSKNWTLVRHHPFEHQILAFWVCAFGRLFCFSKMGGISRCGRTWRFNCSATRIKPYWSYGKPVHYLFIMPNKRTKDSGSENILLFGRILPKNAKLTCRPLSRLEWYVARTVKTCKICIWSSLVSRRNEWTNLW